MASEPQPSSQPSPPAASEALAADRGLQGVAHRLAQTLERDRLVQETLNHLRQTFQVDRVVLYYFYRRWKGQVTSESLSDPSFSILGSTGADDCFNDDYAERYLQGRLRAIADVTEAGLDPCHLAFLQQIRVRANLVGPVLTQKGLWGLLVAHHCRAPRPWTDADRATLREAAQRLAEAPAIRDS